MKFSASFVVLAFVFSKTALALPVDNDGYDLLERDFSGAYDLEARELYDNMYEERSFDDDELFERDLFHEDLEARAGHKAAPKPASEPVAKPKTPAKPAAQPPAKPGAKSPTKKPATEPKKPAGKCKKPTRGGKKPTHGDKKPTHGDKKPTHGDKKPTHGGKKRSFEVRTTTGQTITIHGKQYKLEESTSGSGGGATFKVEGGHAFAKRPRHPGNPPPEDFTREIESTKKASEALQSGLYIADGTDGGYTWLITGAMPGGEVSSRWFEDREKFATKKACEDDLKDALAAVKAAQHKLAGAGLVHGDSHPGNWFVPLTGKIDKALPIDFGITKPADTNIDELLSQQYKYPADHWAAFAGCGICK